MPTTYYTSDHEWLTIDDQVVTIGITDHAQQALGEIVFVELPSAGEEYEKGGSIAVVESVKSASDIYSPIKGKVIEVNASLEDSPETINDSAERDGWFLKIRATEGTVNTDAFMSKESYLATLTD